MFRRPLDLLIASARPGNAARKLPLMGAAVTEVRFDRIIQMLKLGIRVADAIVIESTKANPLIENPVIKSLNLASAIHGVPDYVAMPTGARWNGIPIAVLVDDQWMAEAISADPNFSYVTSCSTRRLSHEYYEYVDPWISIYEQLDSAVYDNTLKRLDEMASVGHRFEEREGRWLRLIPPAFRRKAGSMPELQTTLYDGRADQFLRRKRELHGEWRGKDVLLLERKAIERDLDQYEELVKRPHLESEMQRFYRQRPFVLGAGAFETTDHPVIRLNGSRANYPDFVQHSCNDAIVPKPARVIEIKTNDSVILTQSGLDWHWGRTTSAALAQVRRYTRRMRDPNYRKIIEARFGETPKTVKKLVIAGTSALYDRKHLDLARSYDCDVEVRGYDEMFTRAVTRYS